MPRKTVQYETGDIGKILTEVDGFTGQVYQRKGSISTVEFQDRIIKSARSFESVERAERALKSFKKLGLSGSPTSPSSVFRKVLGYHIENGDVPHPLKALPDGMNMNTNGACWLWIERAVPKDTEVTGTVHHYDINEAFWSATREGLPIKFFPYNSADKNFVARVVIEDSRKDLPYFFQKSLEEDRECLLTGKDIRYFGLDVEIVDALSYVDDYVDLTPVYNTISKHFGPWIQKRARQQSWGTFVMKNGGVQGVRYQDGERQKEWDVNNRFQNRLWGIIITRRIIRKVHRALTKGEGLSCYVDSVLSLEKIETGSRVGEWRNEGEYKNGILLKTPGIWDTRPVSTKRPSEKWKKHSGIRSRKTTTTTTEETKRTIKMGTQPQEYDPNKMPRIEKDKPEPIEPNDKPPWEKGLHKIEGKPGINSGIVIPEDKRLEPPTEHRRFYEALMDALTGKGGVYNPMY